MLGTTGVDPLATDQIPISENSTSNRVGDSEVNRAKVDTKTAKSKSQDKSKNLVKSFLAEF